MFLGKGVLKIFSKFTGEHPCQGAISKKVALQLYGSRTLAWCSPVNLLHIFRIPFPKNTTGVLLLIVQNIFYILEQSFHKVFLTVTHLKTAAKGRDNIQC